MTATSITPIADRRLDISTLAPFAAAFLFATAGMAWQFGAGTHPDVTWLTMMAERFLDGSQLYVDTQENNPPASVYLYVPAVIVARMFGIASELSVQMFTLVLALSMFACAWRMVLLSGYAERFDLRWLLVGASGIFLLMPASTFAQREYIAALLVLAYIGTAAVRSAGARPAPWMICVAGIAIGIVTAIKPPLALVAVFLSLAIAWRRRSWQALFVAENWIGAGLFAVYAAAVVHFHPEFLRDVTPLLKDVYLRDWFPVIALALPTFYVFVFLLMHSALLHRDAWRAPPENLVFVTALAFLASYAMQMKFFDYHAFPVSAFAMLGNCMAICRKNPGGQSNERWIVAVSLFVLVVCGALNFRYYYGKHHDGRLAAAIAETGKAPKVVGFSTHIGQYLREVRLAGGSWVSSFSQTYVPKYAHAFRGMGIVDPQWNERLNHWEAWTADIFRRDLMLKKPDIVLMTLEQDFRWDAWAKRFPALTSELQNYRFARRVELGRGNHPIAIYVRAAR